MLGAHLDKSTFDAFVKDLKKLGHIIASPNMQLYRAQKYREFTINMVKKGQLDLEPLSEVTQMLTGVHNPLYKTGTLVDYMGIKPIGKNAAECGYWGANKTGKPNLAQIAILQSTGYKIPLTGEKGKRVRAWLAMHNVPLQNSYSRAKPKGGDTYLVVPARPWIMISYFAYVFSGEDLKACNEYIDKLLSSPINDNGAGITKGIMKDSMEPGEDDWKLWGGEE
jgi:hypothetical protein